MTYHDRLGKRRKPCLLVNLRFTDSALAMLNRASWVIDSFFGVFRVSGDFLRSLPRFFCQHQEKLTYSAQCTGVLQAGLVPEEYNSSGGGRLRRVPRMITPRLLIFLAMHLHVSSVSHGAI